MKSFCIIVFFIFLGECCIGNDVFTGVLEPAEKEVVVSKCEAVLVKTIAEGHFVKKGEILFQLDTTAYEEQKVQVESELRKLEAQQNVERLQFENRLIQAKQNIASKKVNFEIASLIYNDLASGANEADVKIAEEKVRIAELILKNSKVEFELVNKLSDGGYISKDEVNVIKFRIKNEEESLRLLKQECELTKLGPSSISVEEAKIQMDIRKKEFSNAETQLVVLEKSYSELLQFHSREYKKRSKKLERVQTYIDNCVVEAPISGTVFYERFPWGEKIPIGKNIWEGLKVRSIANLDVMIVKIKIPVEIMGRFQINQKAKIEIFSNGQIVNGEISKIFQIQEDEFADAHNKTKEVLGASNKKIFIVNVKLLEVVPNVKPGMTAKVTFENKKDNEKE